MSSEDVSNMNAVGVTRGANSRKRIETYCTAQGLTLGDVFDGAENRQDAIDAACADHATLIADSLPCVAGSMIDVVRLSRRLKETGTDFVLLSPDDGTPLGILDLLVGMGDLEYRRLADRLPYGYAVADDLEHIVVDAKESTVIRRIIEWHSKGMSRADIAETLNAESIPARRADAWSTRTVGDIVDTAGTSRWEGLA